MTERQDFENNKVFLWGLKQASKKLLDEFDKGNKNPHSISRIKKEEEKEKKPVKKTVKPIKREFSLDEDYNINDLPFLKSESDRIDEILDNGGLTGDEEMKYMDLQEAIYDLIEGLEALKKMTGGKVKQLTKARVEKGSEQAKEIGRRLAEARKAKNADKKAENDRLKEEAKRAKEEAKISKRKPWYYLGDIPKGYREATEDEAIKANKVSTYGKYVVDKTKYDVHQKYNILISTQLSNFELNMYMSIAKKRALKALQDIEIFESKIDNPKIEDKQKYKYKLEEAKSDYKLLNKVYNAFLKFVFEKAGKPFSKVVLKLPPKPEIKFTPSSYKEIQKPVIIDPRTGKPIDEEEEKTKEKYYFYQGKNELILNDTHFDKNNFLKSKIAQKLFDKKIVLPSEYYKPDDYEKFHYIKRNKGSGIYDKIKKYIPYKEYRSPMENITKPLTTPLIDYSYNRLDFSRKAKEILKFVGDRPIQSLTIQRVPVPEALKSMINMVSGGEFRRNLDKMNYDQLYHLALIVQTTDNKIFSIEKNDVVNLDMPPLTQKKQETQNVNNIPPNITMNQMINNYINKFGRESFFVYDGVNNNCQNFILNLLSSSNIGTKGDYEFIKQKTEALFENLEGTGRIMKGITDLSGRTRGLLGGALVPRKPDLNDDSIVQSVLFNKKLWTPERAKVFLMENKYYSGSMDETKNEYRFRQYNPEDLKKGRYYITKPIKNKGILLIISMLRKGGKLSTLDLYSSSDSDSDSSSDEESVKTTKKMHPNVKKLLSLLRKKMKGRGLIPDEIKPVLKEVGKFVLPLVKDELKGRMKKGKGFNPEELSESIMEACESHLKGKGIHMRHLHHTGQEEPEFIGGSSNPYLKNIARAFSASWNRDPHKQNKAEKAVTNFMVKDAFPALTEFTSVAAPPLAPVIGSTGEMLKKKYGTGMKDAIHLDINSHNVKDGEYSMGDGLKKKRGRPRKTTQKVEVVKKMPYERFTHAPNESLRQLLESRDIKDKQSIIKNLSDISEVLTGKGVQKRFVKGSKEAKEHMAKIRAMKKK